MPQTAYSDGREGMNIEEVARYLGIGLRQAYEAARNDKLPVPVVRVGRRMVVSRTALERALGLAPSHPVIADMDARLAAIRKAMAAERDAT